MRTCPKCNMTTLVNTHSSHGWNCAYCGAWLTPKSVQRDLHPCPFCGEKPQLFEPSRGLFTLRHKCLAIKADIKPGPLKNVIARWNCRDDC